ncbi:MAG: hypothetical protein AEth_00675 [Candidatus Argoarchaeum ethanivorans]|uniref:Uncharacterized protein n=1 Tax=Candidatus Argoarchaeum ethanivorans TaxID=2608793 RepID=A0A8B3S2K9_9EURY|nr:MAG: hypothetical protein SRB2_04829 [Desulfobacteraceae bacterium Eth-SRB2]RZB31455.1 MAG: hypothetical protein AEth_00675 [Candidatus Argoarchaeum ethanivorans]
MGVRVRQNEDRRNASVKTYISLFEKIFLELLGNIVTNKSGAFELPPTG